MYEDEIENMFAAAIAGFPPEYQDAAGRWFDKTLILSAAMGQLLTEQGMSIEEYTRA